MASTGFRMVFARECRRMLRSRVVRWGVFAMPLLSALVFLPMMRSGLPTDIPVAVVDMDNSFNSRSLIRQLDNFPKTHIAYRCDDFSQARELMESGEVFAILEIPRNFAVDASTGRRPQLNYYTNNAFLINGSLAFQDLKTVATLASASVGLTVAQAKGVSADDAMQAAQPIVVESHPLGNPWLNYSVYLNNMLLPGMLQLIIVIFTISCFGSEIKSGYGRRVVALAGGSPLKLVLGKLLPYTIVYMLLSLMFIGLLYGICHFPLINGVWPMVLNYLLLIVASQGLGLAVLAVFVNYRFSLSAGCLIGVVSIPLSGFTFPATAMYGHMRAVGNLVPLRHFFVNYVDQALNGLPFGYSAIHYAALGGFALLGLTLCGRVKNLVEKEEYSE